MSSVMLFISPCTLLLLLALSTPLSTHAALMDYLNPSASLILSPSSWWQYAQQINATASVASPALTARQQQPQPYIWPLPYNYTEGSQRTYITKQRQLGSGFSVTYTDSYGNDISTSLAELHTHVQQRVQGMLKRYHSYQFTADTDIASADQHDTQLSESMIVGVDVQIVDKSATLQHGVDESHSIYVPAPDDLHSNTKLKVKVHSQTKFGVVHALETLSQLIKFDFERELYYIDHTPVTIEDRPRFPYRGLLIDTSRHYLPADTLAELVVSMMINKLNVLHWHIVDTQAFPFRSKSHPNITQHGKYSEREQYMQTDIKQLVQFANAVGIRVVFELDVPGHAASWCAGEPQLCPSASCTEPLDITQQYTFTVVEDLLKELTALSSDIYVHLGADEVDTHCWSETPRIADWFSSRNMSMLDGYAYSLEQTTQIASQLKRKPIYWEEAYTSLKTRLPKDATVMSWISKSPTVKQAADDGYDVIMSDTDFYLDHLDVPWQKFYLNDPLADYPVDDQLFDSDSQQYSSQLHSSAQRVQGGEMCMWSETVDPSDLFATIYPRASAGAEQLWSDRSAVGDLAQAEARLHWFRCYLHDRGVKAAPLNNQMARQGPPGPGACAEQ